MLKHRALWQRSRIIRPDGIGCRWIDLRPPDGLARAIAQYAAGATVRTGLMCSVAERPSPKTFFGTLNLRLLTYVFQAIVSEITLTP